MSTNSTENRAALDRLSEAMVEDILNTSDEKLLAEVAEDYGNHRALADEFDNAVARVRRKLAWIKFKQTIARLVETCGLNLFANPGAPIAELQPARLQNWAWNSRPAWTTVAAVLVVIIAAPIVYFSYEHYVDAQRHSPAAQVKFDPNSVTALLDKRPSASGTRQFTIANFDEEIRRDPKNANAFYTRGVFYAETGKYDVAIQDLSEAIRLDPKNAAIISSRGVTYSMELNWDLALKDFNAATGLDPQNVLYYAPQSNANTTSQSNDLALATSNELIRRHFMIIDACSNGNDGGSGSSVKSDYDRAISYYQEALHLYSKFVDIYRNRGRAYFYESNYNAAAADFERVLQQRPDDAYAVLWLYLTRARSGDKNAAAELRTNALKLNQTEWPYPVIELFVGQRESKDVLATALKPNEHCEAQFYVGQWNFLRGNHAAVAESLKAAMGSCARASMEYAGTQAELKRLGQGRSP